ncbi:MAG: hypothetical protein QNI96_07485 [Woeseiaceae bacterium]|nr:hypothetical protein [Woeseiaceae bacterium]
MGVFRIFCATSVALAASAAVQAQGVPSPPSASLPTPEFLPVDPMDDGLRGALRNVVVKPGGSPTNEEIGGDYDQETLGLDGGIVYGASKGSVSTQAGPVNVNIPIPLLQIPAMIAGGIAGATQEEIQEFRDALTEDLADASSQQIVNDKIASDVYNEIRRMPNLEPQVFARDTPVPEGTQAILYVNVGQVLIDVEEHEAIITATVNATVHRHGYDRDVYETTIQYQDRDTLRNWTADDNAAWRNYANFARHYVGREIADRVYGSAGVAEALQPVKSKTVSVGKRNPWEGSSKKLSPTLAWELELPAADENPAWAASIDESNISYDVEIYDLQRPVYRATQVPGPQHTVNRPLQACQKYRWSVRPVYNVGGEIKYGAWMRSGTEGNGNIGKEASKVPAYLYDFAELEIKCGSK